MENSMTAETETCWIIPDASSLSWESWGDQYAVFDARSGETHMLPELTARLLRQLGVTSATDSVLAETCCSEAGEVCDKRFIAQITQLLTQLHNVGQIVKVTS